MTMTTTIQSSTYASSISSLSSSSFFFNIESHPLLEAIKSAPQKQAKDGSGYISVEALRGKLVGLMGRFPSKTEVLDALVARGMSTEYFRGIRCLVTRHPGGVMEDAFADFTLGEAPN